MWSFRGRCRGHGMKGSFGVKTDCLEDVRWIAVRCMHTSWSRDHHKAALYCDSHIRSRKHWPALCDTCGWKVRIWVATPERLSAWWLFTTTSPDVFGLSLPDLLSTPHLRATQPPRRRAQHVYFAQAPSGLIKVGASGRPLLRAAQLGARLVAVIEDGGLEFERQLHEQLAPSRAHGREWFYPTPQVVTAMRSAMGLATEVAA